MISVLASLLAWALAVFLWRLPQSNVVTRRLSSLLVVESMVLLTSSSGLSLLAGYEITNFHGILHVVADLLMFVMYPIFVAYALPGSFLAPLRKPIGLWSLTVVFILAVILTGITLFLVHYIAIIIMFVVVFVACVLGAMSGKTKLARQKALIFAIAFGFRDLCWALTYLNAVFDSQAGAAAFSPPFGLNSLEFSSVLYAGSTLIYIPLVTYGVLKLQLFDVDIRLKTTIRRSTLAAMFIALFFLVSEGANYFLSSMLGDVLGIVVAALLVFFLAPLSRWAEWVSSSLLSRDMQTSEYESYRKFQMYSTAVEETLALGEIGPSQEALLARLRESLNISNEDARKLREDLSSPIPAV